MRVPSPLLLLLAAAALAAPVAGQSIHPGGPTDGGVRAVADLPAAQHMRNTGGSDGAGLCVFTSIEHCSRWQSLVLAGLQQYMTRQPGGGYPDKVDQVLTTFCRQNKRDIPRYVQHTGGDESILDLAMKTGRMVGVTYAGVDDFYQGEVIAHMVNLVYLDGSKAAILDNNRPGQFVWMSRKELLDRWRGVDANGRSLMIRSGFRSTPVGGGWAIVFLDSPPPPYGSKPAESLAKLAGCSCKCGDACECGPKCECDGGQVLYGQCPGGVCPPTSTRWGVPLAAGPVAQPAPSADGDEYVYVPGYGWGKVVKPAPAPTPEAKKAEAKSDPTPGSTKGDDKPAEEPTHNHGIDISKLRPGKWFHNGAEVSKEEVLSAVAGDALADDSERWFLVHVGTSAEQAAFLTAVKTLDAATAAKLHVKAYGPADWQVGQFAIPTGVSLRKPAVGRIGAEAGRLAGELSADTLKRFVGDALNPKPIPAPMPAPTPIPDQPQPTPDTPAPTPSTPFVLPVWLVALVAAALFFWTRRKQS